MAPATADGEIVAEFARMRIGNPLLDEAHSLFDKQHGLFDEPSDFVSGDVVACIHEVANGRLGMASAIICSASMVARKAGAVRVTREHLSIATDTWAVPVGIIDYNPFEDGIRSAACSRAAGLLARSDASGVWLPVVTRSDWGMRSVDMTIKGRKKASHFDELRYCGEPGDRPLECFL